MHWVYYIENFLHDIRYGLRMLVKNPGFTAVALLTLALGIGANTAIFSVVNGLLLHPAGIPHPERLVAIRARYNRLNLPSISISAPDFADIRDSRQIFSSSALLDYLDFNYTDGEWPERLQGARVSWQWFEVFGVRPVLGRVFRPEEDQPNANHEVVVAYETWRRLFGGDASIVGRKIQLNQQFYQVVGVMGPDFRWPSRADLWVPAGLPPEEFAAENRYNENYLAVARIRPDVSFKQASSFTILLTRQDIQRDPAGSFARDSGWGMFIVPLAEFVHGNLRAPISILMGAVALVLLIVCSNIAGLLLARASGRIREFAVRAAIGAGRWDLIRQTFAESLLMAGIGTTLGLALVPTVIQGLMALAPEELTTGLVIEVDGYVLFFAVATGLVAALFFGMAPAWQISRIDPYHSLKEGALSTTTSRARQKLRSLIVVGELALALLLLVETGLLLKSLTRMQEVGTGFDPHGLMTAALTLPQKQYDTPEKQINLFRDLLERLSALPGVVDAAAAYPLPFSGSALSGSFSIEGRVLARGDPGPHGDVRFITPDYFRAMSIPLLQGRYFTDQDQKTALPVVVIDQNLARQYWPDQSPIGQRIRRGLNAPWAVIVGVVGHVKHSALVGDSGKGVYYFSAYQSSIPYGFLVLKTRSWPESLASGIRETVHAVDATQPVHDLKTMDERIAGSLAPRRFAVRLLGIFAGTALFLAALGLYGVVSYSVGRRTQEIGIRMALGAEDWQVWRLVLQYSFRLAGAGAAIGALFAAIVARLLSSQLFEVRALDARIFALAVIALLLAALLAGFFPTRRATKVDPMVALRYE